MPIELSPAELNIPSRLAAAIDFHAAIRHAIGWPITPALRRRLYAASRCRLRRLMRRCHYARLMMFDAAYFRH